MQEPNEYMAGLMQSDMDRYNIIAGVLYSDANNLQRLDISPMMVSIMPETPEGRGVCINDVNYWIPKI